MRGTRDPLRSITWRNEIEQPVVGDLLVVEGRQEEDARRADLAGMAGQRDRILDRAGARAGNEPRSLDTRLDMRVNDPPALVEGE